MKNLLLVLVVVFGFSGTVLADVRFDHWKASDTMIHSGSDNVIEGQSTMLSFNKEGHFALMVFPIGSGSPSGKEVTFDINISVNGQLVKFKATRWENDVMYFSPETPQGLGYMDRQFWTKSKVSFKIGTIEFWWSAKGVQKAWTYFKSTKTAI